MPEDSKTVRTMAEQTLPDFLFSVILEQRKSIATLVDALNEAKAGIDQLDATMQQQAIAIDTLTQEIDVLKIQLAAEAPTESEIEADTPAHERLATICTYQPGNDIVHDDK